MTHETGRRPEDQLIGHRHLLSLVVVGNSNFMNWRTFHSPVATRSMAG